MSSILGHILVGAAIGDNAGANLKKQKVILCLFYVALSIAPDLDYLPNWLFGLNMEPRYSHSVGGCFFISIMGLVPIIYYFGQTLTKASIVLVFASPLSHILLDFMVGVHKNPIFWPFISNTYASNFGVLPSAGRLSITNLYLWRNLVIELGILAPLTLILSATGRHIARNNKLLSATAILSFLFFGYVSHGLHR